MGLRHSSRCLLLRRKMAEAESTEVSEMHAFVHRIRSRGTACTAIRAARGMFSTSLNVWSRSERQSAEFEYDIRKAETVQVCMQAEDHSYTPYSMCCW